MSVKTHSSATSAKSRRRPFRQAVTVAASLALTAGGLAAMAGPAQAANPPKEAYIEGCVVKLHRPWDTGKETVSGKSIVAYPIDVMCNGGQTVIIRQQIGEADGGFNGDDDMFETFEHVRTFNTMGFETIHQEQWLHNTEGGAEETFHKADVWVNGVHGSLRSEEREIRH